MQAPGDPRRRSVQALRHSLKERAMDAIRPAALRQAIGSDQPPLVIDVRRNERFREASDVIRGALRRDPERAEEWARTLPASAAVVVYCVHGHETGGLFHKPINSSSRWITRERPKIDRIACPWLIRRFIDPDAEFLYVPTSDVKRIASERNAEPYDIPDVEFSHAGEECSFDAFLKFFRLKEDPALRQLAIIVRGADTNRLDLAPQAAGLLAVSLGLSRLYEDDHEMLEHGMLVYDALYAWCKDR